jgi:glycosyltransferase involved in cell wall biosynthesis
VRLIYPLMWARPNRNADREQSLSTAAALARRGIEVVLLMPRGPGDPALGAEALRTWFGVEGDFALVQRPSRWAGESLVRSPLWLRQVFRDPILAGADLLYSRMPAMLGIGQRSPLPFATEQYRPWPDHWPGIRPLVRRTASHRKCLGLILHSAFAADAYRRAGVAGEKLLVAHNGANPRLLDAEIGKAAARARVGLASDRPVALYAGRLTKEKGLDQLLALAALRPQVSFVLVGSEGEGAIEAAAAAHPNVRIVPWQGPAELPFWLAAADLLLIPSSRAPLERFGNCVLPLKLFSYLAAGRPILAPFAPDTAELLADGGNASLVPPDRPQAAAAALDRILGDAALAGRLAAAARASALELSWDRRAEKIDAFLRERLASLRDA